MISKETREALEKTAQSASLFVDDLKELAKVTDPLLADHALSLIKDAADTQAKLDRILTVVASNEANENSLHQDREFLEKATQMASSFVSDLVTLNNTASNPLLVEVVRDLIKDATAIESRLQRILAVMSDDDHDDQKDQSYQDCPRM